MLRSNFKSTEAYKCHREYTCTKRFPKHFYKKHGNDQVYSMISLLKKIFN